MAPQSETERRRKDAKGTSHVQEKSKDQIVKGDYCVLSILNRQSINHERSCGATGLGGTAGVTGAPGSH